MIPSLVPRHPSNIRRQIIAAINPRLIEPNAACRCLLLAKSISNYKSIGPFLSLSSRVCPYHLPIKLRHPLSLFLSLPFGGDDGLANWITSVRNLALLEPTLSSSPPPSSSSSLSLRAELARSNLSIYALTRFAFTRSLLVVLEHGHRGSERERIERETLLRSRDTARRWTESFNRLAPVDFETRAIVSRNIGSQRKQRLGLLSFHFSLEGYIPRVIYKPRNFSRVTEHFVCLGARPTIVSSVTQLVVPGRSRQSLKQLVNRQRIQSPATSLFSICTQRRLVNRLIRGMTRSRGPNKTRSV